MVISKRCDCGELDRGLCQCGFFEDPPWQKDEPLFDDDEDIDDDEE